MAVRLKPVTFWRNEVDNTPGSLARVIGPIRDQDLQVVMAYRYTGDSSKAAVEIHPILGKKSKQNAEAAGLSPAAIPALLVDGDNKTGLACSIAKSLGDAGINVAF